MNSRLCKWTKAKRRKSMRAYYRKRALVGSIVEELRPQSARPTGPAEDDIHTVMAKRLGISRAQAKNAMFGFTYSSNPSPPDYSNLELRVAGQVMSSHGGAKALKQVHSQFLKNFALDIETQTPINHKKLGGGFGP